MASLAIQDSFRSRKSLAAHPAKLPQRQSLRQHGRCWMSWGFSEWLPSVKQPHDNGKSHFLMGKLTTKNMNNSINAGIMLIRIGGIIPKMAQRCVFFVFFWLGNQNTSCPNFAVEQLVQNSWVDGWDEGHFSTPGAFPAGKFMPIGSTLGWDSGGNQVPSHPGPKGHHQK